MPYSLPKRYKLISRLKRAGKKGMTGIDFVQAPLYALDYRKMISDLIKDGYNITKKPERKGLSGRVRYFFIDN